MYFAFRVARTISAMLAGNLVEEWLREQWNSGPFCSVSWMEFEFKLLNILPTRRFSCLGEHLRGHSGNLRFDQVWNGVRVDAGFGGKLVACSGGGNQIGFDQESLIPAGGRLHARLNVRAAALHCQRLAGPSVRP